MRYSTSAEDVTPFIQPSNPDQNCARENRNFLTAHRNCSWVVSAMVCTEPLYSFTPVHLFQLARKHFRCIHNSDVVSTDLAVMERFHLDAVLWIGQVWASCSLNPGTTALRHQSRTDTEESTPQAAGLQQEDGSDRTLASGDCVGPSRLLYNLFTNSAVLINLSKWYKNVISSGSLLSGSGRSFSCFYAGNAVAPRYSQGTLFSSDLYLFVWSGKALINIDTHRLARPAFILSIQNHLWLLHLPSILRFVFNLVSSHMATSRRAAATIPDRQHGRADEVSVGCPCSSGCNSIKLCSI